MTRAALQRFYESQAWRNTAKAAKRRDGFLCVHCAREGRTIGAEVVHHVKAIKDGGEKLLLENTVSLCRICHESQHHRGPSAEQLAWRGYISELRGEKIS